MKILNRFTYRIATLFFALSILPRLMAQPDLVRVKDASFCTPNNQPYLLQGMQMWYAPRLAQRGAQGNRQRLNAELDSLKQLGVNCLAVLPDQPIHGKDELQGMDFLLNVLYKRNMKALVLIEANAEQTALKTLETLVNRINKVNKKSYKTDPTILSWHFINLPKSDTSSTLLAHLCQAAQRLDGKHLVSTQYDLHKELSVEEEGQAFQRVLSTEGLNFVSVTFMPACDGWVTESNLIDGLGMVYLRFDALIDTFNRQATRIYKPYVALCGYPRDGMFTLPGSRTDARDAFFASVVSKLHTCISEGLSPFSGIIWYGWAGTARPAADAWQADDAYTAEPNIVTEKKGVYSIFDGEEIAY